LDVIDQCADIEPFRTADKLGQLLGVIDRKQQDVLRSAQGVNLVINTTALIRYRRSRGISTYTMRSRTNVIDG
jgi:hypothetical protein